jgi:hypothetical protein
MVASRSAGVVCAYRCELTYPSAWNGNTGRLTRARSVFRDLLYELFASSPQLQGHYDLENHHPSLQWTTKWRERALFADRQPRQQTPSTSLSDHVVSHLPSRSASTPWLTASPDLLPPSSSWFSVPSSLISSKSSKPLSGPCSSEPRYSHHVQSSSYCHGRFEQDQ